jgi:hypothetical protein
MQDMNQPHINPNQHAQILDMYQYRVQLLHNAAHKVFQIVESAPEAVVVHQEPVHTPEVAQTYFQPTELEQEARDQLAAFYAGTVNGQPTVQIQGEEINLQELFMQSNPVVKPSIANTVKEEYDLAA